MSKRTTHRLPRQTLRNIPFSELVARVPDLSAARREYAGKSPENRRVAAQWAYDAGMAQDLFSRAIRCTGNGDEFDSGFESGVLALAIDPLFAPALLTVGSLEYQYGRVDAAMELFMTLTTLPQTEPELVEVIDKAGCFLLDQKDCPNAERLCRAATEAYPAVVEHWSSLGYCLGKMGKMEEAVATARKALSLNERSPYVLNDLGWTLMLSGLYEEARAVLQRAVALAPSDYHLPRNNLEELEKRARCRPAANKQRS
ncbi:MAG: tetratricopeptide repeat protein [bacterium]